MASEERESKLRTWIEGYGQFGSTYNPDVSMSSNIAGRLQLSANLASPYEVADDLRRYLKSKGYEQFTPDRFFMVMRSAGWATFFDPFISNLTKSSIVFRNGWDESWQLHHPQDSVAWKIERFSFDPTAKYDGWRIAFPYIYKRYSELCLESNRYSVNRVDFVKNWLSCGVTNLQKQIHWMYLFSGPLERDHWISYFDDIQVLKNWLRTGIDPENSTRLIKLGFDSEDNLSIIKNTKVSEVSNWLQSGYSKELVLNFIRNKVSKETADSWRLSGVVPISDVSKWILNGFNLPIDAEDWVSNKFDLGTAVRWKQWGFDDAVEANIWKSIISQPDLARFLIDSGCELSEHRLGNSRISYIFHRISGKSLGYKEMKSMEFLPLSTVAEILKDLQETEFEVSQVIRWRSLGFELHEYPLWIAQGIKPDVAVRYKKFDFGPMQSKDLIERKIPPSHAIEQGIHPTGA